MAITRKYVKQIVIMEVPERDQAIRDLADRYDISIAEAGRRLFEIALPQFDGAMAKAGVTPRSAVQKQASRPAKARKVAKAKVPAATFQAA